MGIYLSNQTSRIINVVNALNGELSHNGYSTKKKALKKVVTVKTQNCECGMINSPAVQECDMCGEEKPELENAA